MLLSLVVLRERHEPIESFAKVQRPRDGLCKRVPSCCYGPFHLLRGYLGSDAASFEVFANGGGVKHAFSETLKLKKHS